ncbi:MAG: hypothetical protein RI894_1547, partial [Bacteroidota bacterium]
MKFLHIGIFATIAFFATRCNETKQTANGATQTANGTAELAKQEAKTAPKSSSFLTTTWRHSREEDKDGARCFRLETYTFPPARGIRTSYTIKPDGTGYCGSTAPNDAEQRENFKWSQTGT